MTPKERMASAMRLREPDRVPVMCQMSIGHMLLQTGLSPSAFWHSAEVFAEGILRLRERYGFDGILISLYGHPAGWEKNVVALSREEGGERLRWANGDETFYPYDDLPVHRPGRPEAKPLFARFKPEELPDRIHHIPVSQGLDFALDPDRLFDVFDRVIEAAGREFSIHGEVTSPLDYFLNLFGFEQALMGMVEDPGRAETVLDRLTEALIPLALGQVDHGADAVKISSPFAGAGFLSPAFYRRFVLPFEGRIARAVARRGVPAYLHTCGDIHDRLELMAGSGASGIECLDPPPLGRVELEDAKKRVGSRVFIKGNLDPVHVLLERSPAEVREDARRRVEIGKPGGGYILSTACSIAPRTPPENILVLLEVAQTHGLYR